MKKTIGFVLVSILAAQSAQAAEWLLKLNRRATPAQVQQELRAAGRAVMSVEDMRFNGWYLVRTATESLTGTEARGLTAGSKAVWIEPNMRLKWYGKKQNVPNAPRASMADPVYQPQAARPSGADPMMSQQWALRDTGFLNVKNVQGDAKVVVAVIDTGIDYNHPDLNGALWMNPGEAGDKAHNGIDDDGNGYVDDFMGYDFVENDNLPYDKTSLFGNPGHGTHCAGVIAAARGNSFGITGIASGVRIMPLRFLSEGGEGTTANAVRAVKYAIDNGAWVLSNSWGGPDDQDADSRILREVFADAATKGRLSIVAAGNDTTDVDAKPLAAVPASFNMPNQITVAATGQGGSLASFSNYGKNLVHLGAPGVGILSTIPDGRFKNMDGTSMATPVVAGAVALYWSQHLQATGMDVRKAVLSSVTPTPALQGRTLTGGRLNIEALMR